jgi:hydroxylamine oxidation protein HaoB
LAAILLVIAGGSILVFGIPRAITDRLRTVDYRTVRELSPGQPDFPDFKSKYPIRRIDRVEVSLENGRPFRIDVAHYRNLEGQSRQALLFLPDDSTGTTRAALEPDLNRLRWRAWLDASRFLGDAAPGKRLFMTWWDNAQRIDLLSGQETWIDAPVADAFDRRQRDFWRFVGGGFGQHSAPTEQLARWLLSDANAALQAIATTVDGTGELYFLVAIDDLARLSEMQALSGKPVPFETRLFRADENIHRLIAGVKRWAREKGTGSYLVQPLADSGIRVWRITSIEGERTLLARLLPFTSSLAEPLKTLDLIHRSDWSGTLSIYRWRPARFERVAPRANTR